MRGQHTDGGKKGTLGELLSLATSRSVSMVSIEWGNYDYMGV